jgi:hypothetical protein
MGEGWSDILAIVLEMESVDTDRTLKAVGQYVTGDTQRGVRQFGYSTNMTTNPLRFSDAGRTQQVHQLGEIWATMLFEGYWNMVNKNGFDIAFRTNPDGNRGNNMFLKDVITGMKLQPCNPTFVQARDAILQADQQLFNGANRCELMRGFAKRGMGANAQNNGQFVDDFTIPPGC